MESSLNEEDEDGGELEQEDVDGDRQAQGVEERAEPRRQQVAETPGPADEPPAADSEGHSGKRRAAPEPTQ